MVLYIITENAPVFFFANVCPAPFYAGVSLIHAGVFYAFP